MVFLLLHIHLLYSGGVYSLYLGNTSHCLLNSQTIVRLFSKGSMRPLIHVCLIDLVLGTRVINLVEATVSSLI
jgi:hypothetical protein